MDDRTTTGSSSRSSQDIQGIRNVIIAIDVGSSSIRCTAYDCGGEQSSLLSLQQNVSSGQQQQQQQQQLLLLQPSYSVVASYSISRKSIEPLTGHIQIDATTTTNGMVSDNLFDTIDTCMDHVVHQLQQQQQQQQQQQTLLTTAAAEPSIQIVGIGFSTFVMNLIGVDKHYKPIGNHVTMSYACSQSIKVQDDVVQQSDLFNNNDNDPVYKERFLNTISQLTGVQSLHTAYALTQLRVWYRHQNQDNNSNPTPPICRVHSWQTIASICLHRWLGWQGENTSLSSSSSSSSSVLPISYSEASWTGLLNIHTGQYASQVLDLLPTECIEALPKVVNYDELDFTAINATTIANPYFTRWPIIFAQQSVTTSTSPQRILPKFFFGIGDGVGATIGSKCTTMNRIACTIGTSAAARVCIYYPIAVARQEPQHDSINDENDHDSNNKPIPQLKIPPGLFCYRIDRFHVLVGGALTDGGNVMEWIQNHLLVTQNRASTSTAENELSLLSTTVASTAAASPSSTSTSEFQLAMQDAEQLLYTEYNEYCSRQNNGTATAATRTATSLMVIPFFSGERNTGYRSNATGAMIGLTLQTRSHHIIKACLEGITLRLNAIIQLICVTVLPLIRQEKEQHRNQNDDDTNNALDLSMMILCSGKALEVNSLWRTMIADCTGLTVYMEEQTNEGTSRGVAILLYHALLLRQQQQQQQQQQQKYEPLHLTSAGRFAVEDIITVDHYENDPSSSTTTSENVTKSGSTTMMIQKPNPNVKGYWTSLSERQEIMINALYPTTLQW